MSTEQHSAENDAPTFGQPVEFTWTLTRRYDHHSDGHRGHKVWKVESYPGQPEPAPRGGILVGVRALSNGVNTYHGYDEPIVYKPTETFRAYLIAYDLRRKPVLVLPEHTTPIPPAMTKTTPTPAAPSRRAEVNGEGV